MEKLITNSNNETRDAGKEFMLTELAKLEQGSVVVLLEGELGAGKTQFVKGIADALEVQTEVRSPSFTYEKSYPFALGNIQGELIHLDLWRVAEAANFDLLDLQRHLQPGRVVAIEWAGAWESSLEKDFQGEGVNVFKVKISTLNSAQREVEILARQREEVV